MNHKSNRYKIIPQNYLAEEILLGIILIYPQVIDTIKSLIKEDYFFIEANRIVYLKIIELIDKNKFNISEIFYELENEKLLNKVGGFKRITYLMEQSQLFVHSYRMSNYVKQITLLLEIKYLKRLIIQLGYNIIKIGYINNINNQYLHHKVSSYLKTIENIIINCNHKQISNIKDLISKELLKLKYREVENYTTIKKKRLRSGFLNLDQITNGLPIGNLIIIAGRPGVGKTSFAINIAYNCFLKYDINVLIFSLEMSSNELLHKFLSMESKTYVEQKKIKNENSGQWETVSSICYEFLKKNIYISENNNIDITQIEIISEKLKKLYFIELLIIDYLQLVETRIKEEKVYNRNQEIGYITRRLKLMSQYLEIPIIAISQLNRNIEHRNNKEPLLSDLKESGCINYNQNLLIKQQNHSIYTIKNNQEIKNKHNSISILNKNVFRCFSKEKNLNTTYNHRILDKNIWINLKNISTKINKFYTQNRTKGLYKQKYIYKIFFYRKSKVYDLDKKNYFHLISNYTLLHNSIEQDADIILILYDIYETQYRNNKKQNKIIDLRISKNRNGHTGHCQLSFEPKQNIFKSINKEIN
uniref:DNA 5'-3' helicase n=1 Tax=Tolypiocladia glomerulata TaxID=860646 RepID=A0A1Z1MVD0_9FLOR|nr:Replication helicase subunit [Tolypiocladia glomerulata]ARW69821.1 Replication helicase subunit [Tolypiocladia glomerulata]